MAFKFRHWGLRCVRVEVYEGLVRVALGFRVPDLGSRCRAVRLNYKFWHTISRGSGLLGLRFLGLLATDWGFGINTEPAGNIGNV